MPPQQGYLLLADISGYTAFLTQGELEHAQAILSCLFEVLLKELRPPFTVCELEGDAIFAYAPGGAFLQGQTLLESIEHLYCTFAATRERMHRNTSCPCTACTLIPKLDLKFAVHHGAFVLQRGVQGQASKPSGPDVILVHRLLKNTIREATGLHSYVFFTRACAGAARLEPLLPYLHPHAETYEHLGRVEGYVYDLLPAWAWHREHRRVAVPKAEAWFTCEVDLPAPPAVAWDYLHEPERKRRWMAADSMSVTGLAKGRTTVGATHHCAHGKMVVLQQIVDWRPFEYATFENGWPMDAVARTTTYLSPHGEGTRVTTAVAAPAGCGRLHRVLVTAFYAFLRRQLCRDYQGALDRLREMVEADRQAGRTRASLAEPVEAA